jgi:hypothetical protein
MSERNDLGNTNQTTSTDIELRILVIRGTRILLDRDLAALYGVTTKRLNEQIKRNPKRFPADFMFQLTKQEKDEVVANCDHLRLLRYSPTLPNAFTEHGAIMAANVLQSDRAAEMSLWVVRAFIRMRKALTTHAELTRWVAKLETRIDSNDLEIKTILQTLKILMRGPKRPKRIGFRHDERREI